MAALMGPIDQIGYLVDDLDTAVAQWTRDLGVGPWLLFRNVVLGGVYRGAPTLVTMDVALGYQGSIQIELIKATNDAPSPYRDAAGKALAGIHHVAWAVDDLDAALAAMAGPVPVFRAGNASTRVAYLEPAGGGAGVLYELIEGDGIRAMMDAGIAASRNWDGTNPVTTINMAR